MTIKNIISSFGLALFLFAQNSYSEVLNSGHFIYGEAGSERGDIVRKIPGAKPAYRLSCEAKKCKKVVSGYLVKRTPALDKAVQSHLSQFVTHNATHQQGALEGAANGASAAVAQDLASTSLALASGATELNPLLGASPSGAVLLAVGLIRHQAVQAEASDTRLSFETRARNVCMSSGISQGAAANNIALLATGAGALPVIVGLIVGQARMSSCMTAAFEARDLITHQENMALQAYAQSLNAKPATNKAMAVAGMSEVHTASL
jgi:hypothetical protein